MPRRISAMLIAAAKDFVDVLIQSNKVLLFTKSHCPYSKKAKAAVAKILSPEEMSRSVTVIDIDLLEEDLPAMDAIQDALQTITGARSVPRVFVDGEFIGGGDDTVAKADTGELRRLFIDAGVRVFLPWISPPFLSMN